MSEAGEGSSNDILDTFAIALAPEIDNGVICILYRVIGVEVRLMAYWCRVDADPRAANLFPHWLIYPVQQWKNWGQNEGMIRKMARKLAKDRGAAYIDATVKSIRPPGKWLQRVDVADDWIVDLLRSSATRRKALGLEMDPSR